MMLGLGLYPPDLESEDDTPGNGSTYPFKMTRNSEPTSNLPCSNEILAGKGMTGFFGFSCEEQETI
jgi:hypothetical protein